MVEDKRPAKELVGKLVVTKEGKNLGEVKDVTFEVRTGELVHVILKNTTKHAMQLGIEKIEEGFTVPYNSIIAVGDFVVVAEEDLL
ncbi:MAG: PRC-barrel domain-containing protein [Nanoarchaeota archaeon]|nr:PRC-barrel domain-containing protein [Nanoarchaeota archaeon]